MEVLLASLYTLLWARIQLTRSLLFLVFFFSLSTFLHVRDADDIINLIILQSGTCTLQQSA